MRLTLVSYFFHPVSNVAAERWTRYAKALATQGHEIHVLTGPWGEAVNHQWTARVTITCLGDPVSKDAVVQRAQSTPAATSTRNLGQVERRSWKDRLPLFLAIDGKFVWSLRVFLRLIGWRTPKPDLVIVTGTPWSSVVSATLAATLRRMPLVVDFRDFWAAEPHLHFTSPAARRYFAAWERFAVHHADAILTVNDILSDYFKRIRPRVRTTTLPHGFEDSLSWNSDSFNSTKGKQPWLLYAGSISAYHGFDRFLKKLATEQVKNIAFMGTDYTGITSQYSEMNLLGEQSPAQTIETLQQAGVLLVTLGPESTHYTTGKLMTYLKAGRPILLVGPEKSPAAELIRRHDLGWVIDTEDGEHLRQTVRELLDNLEKGKPFAFHPEIDNLRDYSIEKLGAKLNACLLEVVNQSSSKT